MNPEAYYKMTYGIYLVSSKAGEQMSGYIANTVFQVTASPPKIAISCHKKNISAATIDQSGFFAVSILDKETDAGLIGLFGYQTGNEDTKFDRIKYKLGVTGTPIILTHAIASFECKVTDKFDIGTHILFIGEVVEDNLLHPENEPLTYDFFRNNLKLSAPERAPTFIDKNKNMTNQREPREVKTKTTSNKYICTICAYIYDQDTGDETQGISPGTLFESLPDDWVCPVCSAAKSMFIIEN
jgi:flavin reductase (DIM6/NTAB) family NADH-FMN oxidoreductase RutF/rubredoxin